MDDKIIQLANHDLSHVFEAQRITSIEMLSLSLTANRRRDRETGGAI